LETIRATRRHPSSARSLFATPREDEDEGRARAQLEIGLERVREWKLVCQEIFQPAAHFPHFLGRELLQLGLDCLHFTYATKLT
jgi:hypothetical protein